VELEDRTPCCGELPPDRCGAGASDGRHRGDQSDDDAEPATSTPRAPGFGDPSEDGGCPFSGPICDPDELVPDVAGVLPPVLGRWRDTSSRAVRMRGAEERARTLGLLLQDR
jgi:hypothetical protein